MFTVRSIRTAFLQRLFKGCQKFDADLRGHGVGRECQANRAWSGLGVDAHPPATFLEDGLSFRAEGVATRTWRSRADRTWGETGPPALAERRRLGGYWPGAGQSVGGPQAFVKMFPRTPGFGR
jgi:hypothetical protein